MTVDRTPARLLRVGILALTIASTARSAIAQQTTSGWGAEYNAAEAQLAEAVRMLRQRGDVAEADRIAAGAALMRRIHDGAPPDAGSLDAELHVVGSYLAEESPFVTEDPLDPSSPAPLPDRSMVPYPVVTVRVDYVSAPIVLALLADYSAIRWDVRLGPGVRIEKVVLSQEQADTVIGLPYDTPVVREPRTPEGNGLTIAEQGTPPVSMARALQQLTGLRPATLQEWASNTLSSHEFVIGPKSEVWCVQEALFRSQQLLDEADAIVAKTRLAPILASAIFIESHGGERFVTTLDGSRREPARPPTATQVVQASNAQFALDPRALWRVDGEAATQVDPPPGGPSLEPAGLVFDERRTRIFVLGRSSSSELRSYDVTTRNWSVMTITERGMRTEMGVDAPYTGLAHWTRIDRLLTIRTSRDGEALSVVEIDPRSGHIDHEVKLDRRILTTGVTQLTMAGDELLIVARTRAHDADLHTGAPQIFIVDPGSGHVVASWFLSTEAAARDAVVAGSRVPTSVGWRGGWTVAWLDPATDEWQMSTSPPTPLASAAVAYGERAVAVVERAGAARGWLFDGPTRTWHRIPPAPMPLRRSHLVAFVDDVLVLWNTGVADEAAAFDTRHMTWRRLQESRSVLREQCCPHLADGRRLIVWGGTEVAERLPAQDGTARGRDDGLVLDVDAGVWAELPSRSPIPYEAGTLSASWKGRLLVLGGAARNAVLTYDPRTESWQRLADAPFAFAPRAAVATDDDTIFVWSGDGASPDGPDPRVRIFDARTSTWRSLRSAPVRPRVGARALFLGDRVAVWGGWQPDAAIAEPEGALVDVDCGSWALLPRLPQPVPAELAPW